MNKLPAQNDLELFPQLFKLHAATDLLHFAPDHRQAAPQAIDVTQVFHEFDQHRVAGVGDAGFELFDGDGVRQSAGRDEFEPVGEHEDPDFRATDGIVAVDAGVDQQFPQHFIRRKRARIDPFGSDNCGRNLNIVFQDRKSGIHLIIKRAVDVLLIDKLAVDLGPGKMGEGDSALG